MRTVGVVTVARSDYGIYLPVLKEIRSDPDLRLYLIAAGMHLSPEFGLTVERIEADGFHVDERVEMLLSSDTPEGIAKSVGLGVIGFSQVYARSRPDILVVVGDRYEMYSAALAAHPFRIPIAHIHGGELTLGAIDDALRHSMTKLSHLHFASTDCYARRIVQMGEEPWRVTVSGAPSLDNLASVRSLTARELTVETGLRLEERPLLVTFHPVTLEFEQTQWQFGELLAALSESKMPVIFTMPNADTGGRIVEQMMQEFVSKNPTAQMAANLGTQRYFSIMSIAAAMVGNSSSGIIEAASFRLPVVNIGNRQRGRAHGPNVVDVGYDRQSIVNAIQQATEPGFRDALGDSTNIYGDGRAASRIVKVLREVGLGPHLVTKEFHDLVPACVS